MRYGVILAGGGGTRLWPASRRSRPKQLLPLGPGGQTLIAASWRRLSRTVPAERALVVTARSQAAGIAAELPDLATENLLCEPVGKNTAAAVGLAAVHARHRDADAVLAVLPADHHVGDEDGFAAVLETAFAAAEAATIATIGVVPTRPETGYGYLRLGEPAGPGPRRVAAFVEKPDAATARRYLEAGDTLWNAGMFFARADLLLAEIERHLPETGDALARVARALAAGEDWEAEAGEVYPALPSVSIDHGVMEKTSAPILAVPGDFGWSDVGSWTALAELRAADAAGNAALGDAAALDARNNIVFADAGKLVGIVGVEDLVVVASGDAVLVCPRDRAQDVRELVALIARSGGEGHL